METIEAAFLLASARRLFRDPALPPLRPIRSLHYFLPVIEEVSAGPLSSDYVKHLRLKLAPSLDQSSVAGWAAGFLAGRPVFIFLRFRRSFSTLFGVHFSTLSS